MSGRFIFRASAFAIASIFIIGCQQDRRSGERFSPNNSQSAYAPPITAPTVATPATQPATADVLAQRVNVYAQEIGPLIDRRSQTAATQPAVKVAEDRAASATQPARVVPIPNPVVDNQPSAANQSASLEAQTPAMQAGLAVTPTELNKTVVAVKPAAPGADLEAKLAKHLQESPREVWAHLDYQLLQFLRDEQVPQLDALSSLPLEDRELVSIVMDGLTNFRNGLRADNNMLLSKKIKPLIELADRLRSQADLSIPAMALCRKVDAFGIYEPIDPPRFVAGKEHTALLYCEIENFASTSVAEKKLWETRLSQEATLYTESGMPVWVDKAGKVVDRSRNRRHDFYIVKKIHLPATLTLGRYLLKVTVEDQEAKRLAEQTIPVEIVAQLDTPEATAPAETK